MVNTEIKKWTLMLMKAQKFEPLGKKTKQILCYIRYAKMHPTSKTVKA